MYQVEGKLEDEALADALEDWFCELESSPWMLIQERPGRPYRLAGFFGTGGEALAAWAELRGHFARLPPEPRLSAVAERDWTEAYKAYLHPWSCRDLHWVPAWERGTYPVPAGEVALYLDAGMAFGTGDHATTRLCARALLDYRDGCGGDLEGRAVVDAGCGSGILTLSALRLGFDRCRGFDLDPDAVRVSGENAVANGLAGRAEFTVGGIEEALSNRAGEADLLLANILADVLCRHAGTLLTAVADGGTLVLSGVLACEAETVRAHFIREAGRGGRRFDPAVQPEGEWVSLVGVVGAERRERE